MTAGHADMRAHGSPELALIARKLGHGERVDVHDADLFVGLDDAVPNDAVITVGPSSSVGATGPAVLSRATASDETKNDYAQDERSS